MVKNFQKTGIISEQQEAIQEFPETSPYIQNVSKQFQKFGTF